MTQWLAPHVFYGTAIHAVDPRSIDILPSTLIAVSHDGLIIAIEPDLAPADLPSRLAALGLSSAARTILQAGQFLIPGFIDTHNHAPQWLQRGLGQGMHILDWLSGITFPSEAKFADAGHARRAHSLLVQGTLRQGITTACYYSSLHGEAARGLASLCLARGQRAFVGKCGMDRGSPDWYRDGGAAESLAETERCIAHMRTIDREGRLVRPILTPRFAISCSRELLAGLGDLAARDPSLAIQTHFCEARQEVDETKRLFPEFADEADLYAHFGLLTPRTILAHCTVLTPHDARRLRELDCGIAHCPTANMTVGGGFMAAPVREFLRREIKVGLGTDSGGGFSSSMLDAMRHALMASFARDALYDEQLLLQAGEKQDNRQLHQSQQHLYQHHQPGGAAKSGSGSGSGLSLDELFYMATMGGARVVGRDHEIGNFVAGKQFDALVVDMREERNGTNAPLEDSDSPRTVLEKFIMTGDDRNIVEVFVWGRKVHSL